MHKEILVIDDNPDIRFLVCNILDEGFNISSIIWLILFLLSFDDKIVILSTKFLNSLTFPGQFFI